MGFSCHDDGHVQEQALRRLVPIDQSHLENSRILNIVSKIGATGSTRKTEKKILLRLLLLFCFLSQHQLQQQLVVVLLNRTNVIK